jgi:hypothetical protein
LISYSGGSVTAGSTCTVQLDVVCATPGSFVNTSGALTSSSGISGTANATLTLNPQPLFSKSFTPDSVFSGAVSTLIFTIDNSNSTVAADDLNFTDNLPSGITIAAAPNAVTTCTRGTLQAVAGTGIISYSNGTVNAAGSCTVQVSVTVIGSDGVVTNTSGDLTSSLGNSGPATASIAVVDSIFQDQFESGLQ